MKVLIMLAAGFALLYVLNVCCFGVAGFTAR
jgi:hypothetical protein